MLTLHSKCVSSRINKRGNLAMMLVVLITVVFTMMALLGYIATVIKDTNYDNEYTNDIANVDASINAVAQIGEKYFANIVAENGNLLYVDVVADEETIVNLMRQYMVVKPENMRLQYKEDIYQQGIGISFDLIIISFTYKEIEYNVGFYVNGGVGEHTKGEYVFSWIS